MPESMRVTSFARLLVAIALAMSASPVAAQTVPAAPAAAAPAEAAIAAAITEHSELQGPPVTFSYANRPIVQLRAALLGRGPTERVLAARVVLDRIVSEGVTGPVTSRQIDTLITMSVGGHFVFTIMPADVDTLAGETQAATAALAASRLQTALNEVAELRRPRQLIVGGLQALLASAVFVAIIWGLMKVRGRARLRLGGAAERRLQASAVGDREFLRSSRIVESLQGLVTFLAWALGLAVGYAWITFVLRRFPYTRPWGESLREFLIGQLSFVGLAMLDALPELFTVLVIALVTRFTSRVAHLLFEAVESGRVTIPWVYPETAQPTRKLVDAVLWMFAIAIAYPFLPGSDSDAFKGVSVFVGLMISLGSSGLVNQVMSGFTLTYSRALRKGDFVAVGDVEGTVTQVGTLSTKITTVKGEDVTIPNALVVSQTVTNYSRLADTEGVFVPTEITIGYDVPWRQVEALLLLAAARTAGVRRQPAPRVRQAALEDFYIRYSLQFCLEHPADRRNTLAAVHANILDAFNEYGVQITSPNYEADPDGAKIVPRDQWFAAPAVPTAPAVATAPAAVDGPDAVKLTT
jgi:small-conductance mechanosensitive channel